MKLKSRQTGTVKEVSEAAWELMKQDGRSENYTVLTEKPEKKVEQKPKIEFRDLSIPQEPTRQDMFEYLESVGMKQHPNIGDNKLKERYYEQKTQTHG